MNQSHSQLQFDGFSPGPRLRGALESSLKMLARHLPPEGFVRIRVRKAGRNLLSGTADLYTGDNFFRAQVEKTKAYVLGSTLMRRLLEQLRGSAYRQQCRRRRQRASWIKRQAIDPELGEAL